MAVSVIGVLTLEFEFLTYEKEIWALSTDNSLNSYLAINLPFLIKALSTLEISVLNEQIIWMFKQSESKTIGDV